jgi:GT2 family glycosyltransferase
MPDLSIIIVGWNTRDLLRDCLASIDAGTGALDVEVIVVDNASHDGTTAMVAAEFPHVVLIANEDNRGFAAANNQGLRVARGRYVLLLNPDTVVLDDVLPRALEWADTHPDAGVIGCQVMESADRVQRTCFRFPSLANTFLWTTGLSGRFPRSAIAGRAAYGPWNRDCEREVDVVSGMFMLVRREALAAVGLMDEGYFVYAEEADWCRRFRDRGWRCVFAPVGRILHVEGGNKSTDQASVRMFVQMQKSVMRYHRKHSGPVTPGLARGLFVVTMTARAAWWRARAVVDHGRARHRARQATAAVSYHLLGREPAW